MTYASLWSFSYFTFTLNQLLTPDTREYVYTKIWALHRYSFWCRSADFEICLCVIIALQFAQSLSHVSNETLYLFSTNREGTCTSLRLAGHGSAIIRVFTEKRQKKILESRPWSTMVGQSTMVNHGWPWFGKAFLTHSQPWLTMVWQSFSKPWSTMVNHRFVKWHLSQPWLTMVDKSIVNHGQPWLAKALSTMVNHGWQKHCQPWLTMLD